MFLSASEVDVQLQGMFAAVSLSLPQRIFFSGCAGMWERQLVRLGVIIVAWVFIIHQLPTVRKWAERVSDYRTVWLCSSVWSWRAEEPCPLISCKCDEASGTIKSGSCGAYGVDCFQLLADSRTDRHGSAMSEVGGRKRSCFSGLHLNHRVNFNKHAMKFATDSLAQTLHEFGWKRRALTVNLNSQVLDF